MGEYRTRTHKICLRLSDKEYEALESNREKCGLTQQAYLRKMCLNVRPNEQPPMEFFDVLNELSGISVAMVQMAFAADRNRLIDREAYWESVKRVNEQINVLLHQVLLREEELNE